MSTIEAMAKDICHAGTYDWDDQTETARELFRRDARAALTALAENVTEEMIAAAKSILCEYDLTFEGEDQWAEKLFAAMISAAK